MQYRHLGRAGVRLSTVGLGSWLTYGQSVEQELAVQCIHKAYEEQGDSSKESPCFRL